MPGRWLARSSALPPSPGLSVVGSFSFFSSWVFLLGGQAGCSAREGLGPPVSQLSRTPSRKLWWLPGCLDVWGCWLTALGRPQEGPFLLPAGRTGASRGSGTELTRNPVALT